MSQKFSYENVSGLSMVSGLVIHENFENISPHYVPSRGLLFHHNYVAGFKHAVKLHVMPDYSASFHNKLDDTHVHTSHKLLEDFACMHETDKQYVYAVK